MKTVPNDPFSDRTVGPATESERKKSHDRAYLINKINFVHFVNGSLTLQFKHPGHNRLLTLRVKPQPCRDENLLCLWGEAQQIDPSTLGHFQLQHMELQDPQQLLIAHPSVVHLGAQGVNLLLPETCFEAVPRKITRHACEGIKARLSQHGVCFEGALLDYSAAAFRIEIVCRPSSAFVWINAQEPVYAWLGRASRPLLAESCRMIRQTTGHRRRQVVLAPLSAVIERLAPREFKSVSIEPLPQPLAQFNHPLIGSRFQMPVTLLSGTALQVGEELQNAVLMPGLILPRMELIFSDRSRLRCSAQVIGSDVGATTEGVHPLVCKLALLDMPGRDHLRLLTRVYRKAPPQQVLLCPPVDLEALWRFFFETGFVYPDKYAALQQDREVARQTFERLYSRISGVARHFIYQEQGRILGHIALLRVFPQTWMAHHHAASRSMTQRAGLAVLFQINRFINDSRCIPSNQMAYIICYYRPDNKFPRRVFGGAAEAIADPKGCSRDAFGYFHARCSRSPAAADLPAPWRLDEAGADDLAQFSTFYEKNSGGLLVEALALEAETPALAALQNDFRREGFRRERFLYALRMHASLKALIMVNLSDTALNLSDLTNCIHLLALDPQALDPALTALLIDRLLRRFCRREMPVLVFPEGWAQESGLPVEKRYMLWSLNTAYADAYLRFLTPLLRFFHD